MINMVSFDCLFGKQKPDRFGQKTILELLYRVHHLISLLYLWRPPFQPKQNITYFQSVSTNSRLGEDSSLNYSFCYGMKNMCFYFPFHSTAVYEYGELRFWYVYTYIYEHFMLCRDYKLFTTIGVRRLKKEEERKRFVCM